MQRRLDALGERLIAKSDELARERAVHGPQSGRIQAIDYEQLVSMYKATLGGVAVVGLGRRQRRALA